VWWTVCEDVPPSLSGLSRTELEALVVELFGEVTARWQVAADLRAEIAHLKDLAKRPRIGPSGMDKGTDPPKRDRPADRRGRGHAERLVHELDAFNDLQRAAQRQARGLIWDFYARFKAYRPDPAAASAWRCVRGSTGSSVAAPASSCSPARSPPKEWEYIRRELDIFFGMLPSVADGFHLRT
jgi:hypothetical protein